MEDHQALDHQALAREDQATQPQEVVAARHQDLHTQGVIAQLATLQAQGVLAIEAQEAQQAPEVHQAQGVLATLQEVTQM